MNSKKIGVFSESFKLGLYGGIKKAAEIGAGAVQISTASDEIAPWNFDKAQRAELKKFVADNGLVIASICGDLGGHGLAAAKDNIEKLPKYLSQVDLALDLGCDTITTHIGIVPEDMSAENYHVLQDAMGKFGLYAQNNGIRLAIETGPETPEVLMGFVNTLPESVGINLDPANLVMVTGADPVKAVYTFNKRIYHTHVKDGKMLKYIGPKVIYTYFAEGGIEDMRMEEYFLETPLGQGSVDLPAWLKALDEVGYKGYYTIEREVGGNPEGDIRAAIDFLKGI